MIDHHPHISDLRWDRVLAGEPLDDEAASHAAACTACAARSRELIARRDAFAARPALAALVAPVRRPRRIAWLAAAGALAAALVALRLVRPSPDGTGEQSKGAGEPELIVGVGRPDGVTRLLSGDAIYPGETLQAGYSSERDGFGAVLAVDGAGTALVYQSSGGDAMVALPAGRERSFPASTVLDDVTGSERVAIAWCDAAHPLAPMLAQLRTTGRIDAPPGCVIRVVVLTKRARP